LNWWRLNGVSLGGRFPAKACSRVARDASKIALCHLAAAASKGRLRFDSQPVSDRPSAPQFGTNEIDRAEYKSRLASLRSYADLFGRGFPLQKPSIHTIGQSRRS